MSQPETFSQSSNASHGNGDAQQSLDSFWDRALEEITKLSINDFKSQELPLARIKKIMKLDEDVKMISAEAPVLFAKAAEVFITELSLRAWVHTEDNKRRTLQRNDIAMAITKYDQFDFLIDIVPREDIKPPKRQEDNIRTAAMHPDQVQYYFQLAQQHQAALQQQTPAQQGQQAQIQQATPQQVSNETAQQAQAAQVQVQVQNAQQSQAQQVLQLQHSMAGQVNQAGGGIQIVQQVVNSNGEIQQIPIQLSPNNQLQFIRMPCQGQSTNQPIIIHAAPVQQNAQVQQTATQVSAENMWNGVESHEPQQFSQTVYQIQQVAQASGQVATTATPVFLTQAPGAGGAATVQIQTVTADQHSSTDEEQQQ
ncbi:nuclear transcription factor Y subunit gamma isoform X6 [Parasteatoda tepidariorum]|uniref:nuclear transcription factor Y subunit gamma isoform X6 n=1 Tax=Parasteatoda tepidariorum TaxID=114398 RepID=UPI0039BD23FB